MATRRPNPNRIATSDRRDPRPPIGADKNIGDIPHPTITDEIRRRALAATVQAVVAARHCDRPHECDMCVAAVREFRQMLGLEDSPKPLYADHNQVRRAKLMAERDLTETTGVATV